MSIPELPVYIMLVLYVFEKAGIFSWISKVVHARLPREKSMAIHNLTKTKVYDVVFRDKDGARVLSGVQVEFLDTAIVVNHETVIPYFSVIKAIAIKIHERADEQESRE